MSFKTVNYNLVKKTCIHISPDLYIEFFCSRRLIKSTGAPYRSALFDINIIYINIQIRYPCVKSKKFNDQTIRGMIVEMVKDNFSFHFLLHTFFLARGGGLKLLCLLISI